MDTLKKELARLALYDSEKEFLTEEVQNTPNKKSMGVLKKELVKLALDEPEQEAVEENLKITNLHKRLINSINNLTESYNTHEESEPSKITKRRAIENLKRIVEEMEVISTNLSRSQIEKMVEDIVSKKLSKTASYTGSSTGNVVPLVGGAAAPLSGSDIASLLDNALGSSAWRRGGGGTGGTLTGQEIVALLNAALGSAAWQDAGDTVGTLTGQEIVALLNAALGSAAWQSAGDTTRTLTGPEIIALLNTALGSTAWQGPGDTVTGVTVEEARDAAGLLIATLGQFSYDATTNVLMFNLLPNSITAAQARADSNAHKLEWRNRLNVPASSEVAKLAGDTFTGAVSGITPTDDANFATKGYVDNHSELPTYTQAEQQALFSRAGSLFWQMIRQVPTSGDTGQILTKTGSGATDYAFRNAPSGGGARIGDSSDDGVLESVDFRNDGSAIFSLSNGDTIVTSIATAVNTLIAAATIQDRQIPASIARDAEIASTYAALAGATFTGRAEGIDPSTAQSFATRGYVGRQIASALTGATITPRTNAIQVATLGQPNLAETNIARSGLLRANGMGDSRFIFSVASGRNSGEQNLRWNDALSGHSLPEGASYDNTTGILTLPNGVWIIEAVMALEVRRSVTQPATAQTFGHIEARLYEGGELRYSEGSLFIGQVAAVHPTLSVTGSLIIPRGSTDTVQVRLISTIGGSTNPNLATIVENAHMEAVRLGDAPPVTVSDAYIAWSGDTAFTATEFKAGTAVGSGQAGIIPTQSGFAYLGLWLSDDHWDAVRQIDIDHGPNGFSDLAAPVDLTIDGTAGKYRRYATRLSGDVTGGGTLRWQ